MNGTSSVDLPSQNLAQNRQYRDTVTCLPAHNEQRVVKVAQGSNNLHQKWQYRDTAPTNDTNKDQETIEGHRMNQRCTIMTKTCFAFRTRMPVPTQTAVQQMMIVR